MQSGAGCQEAVGCLLSIRLCRTCTSCPAPVHASAPCFPTLPVFRVPDGRRFVTGARSSLPRLPRPGHPRRAERSLGAPTSPPAHAH